MSTNKTETLKLHNWEGSDNVSRIEFNENFNILDQAIADRGVNVKWFGAKGDGKTDDTQALTSAFEYISNNEKIVKLFFPSGNYRTRNFSAIDLNSDIHVIGENATIIFETDGELLNIINENLYIHFQNMNFIAETTGLFVILWRLGTIFTKEIIFDNCYFEGDLSAIRYYMDENTNPLITKFGVGFFRLVDCKVKNTNNSFMVLSDCPSDHIVIERNYINNFSYQFASIAIENGQDTYEALLDSKKLLTVKNNFVYCDDDWWGQVGSGGYYSFVLFEGAKVIYENNHVEGMKYDGNIALYDIYASVREIYYTNNTWINNISFSDLNYKDSSATNTLMKAKNGPGAFKRYFANNYFKTTKEFAEMHGKDPEQMIVHFMDLSDTADEWIIKNNTFHIYRMKFSPSSEDIYSMKVVDNEIECEHAEGAIIYYRTNSNVDYANKSHVLKGNTIRIRKRQFEGTITLVKTVDYSDNQNSIPLVVVENNNVIAPLAYCIDNIRTEKLIFKDNYVEHKDDENVDLYAGVMYGPDTKIGELANINNNFVSKIGMFFEPRTYHGHSEVTEDFTITRKGVSSYNSSFQFEKYNPDVQTQRFLRDYEITSSEGTVKFRLIVQYGYDSQADRNYVTYMNSSGEQRTRLLYYQEDDIKEGDGESVFLYDFEGEGPQIEIKFENSESYSIFHIPNFVDETKEYTLHIRMRNFPTTETNLPVVSLAGTSLSTTANVRDFGATGDGVTDDAAAIDSAIAYMEANPKVVNLYFPKGVYFVTDRLVVPSTTNIIGDGMTHSIINTTDGADGIIVSDIGDNQSVHWRDFTINGGGRDAIHVGGGFADFKFTNVSANNASRHGFYFVSCENGVFENCVAQNNAECGFYSDNTDNVTHLNCKAINNVTGIFLGDYSVVNSCIFKNNHMAAIHADGVISLGIRNNIFDTPVTPSPTENQYLILLENCQAVEIASQYVFRHVDMAIGIYNSHQITLSALAGLVTLENWLEGDYTGLFVDSDSTNITITSNNNYPFIIEDPTEINIISTQNEKRDALDGLGIIREESSDHAGFANGWIPDDGMTGVIIEDSKAWGNWLQQVTPSSALQKVSIDKKVRSNTRYTVGILLRNEMDVAIHFPSGVQSSTIPPTGKGMRFLTFTFSSGSSPDDLLSILLLNGEGMNCEIGGVKIVEGYYHTTNFPLAKEQHLVEKPTFINVLDHFADPTGVEDCSEAFDLAVAEAINKGISNIYIPTGRYELSDIWKVPNYINIYGDGMNNTILNSTDQSDAIRVLSLDRVSLHWRDFSVNCDGGGRDGLHLTGVDNFKLSNIKVTGAAENGIYISTSSQGIIENCVTEDNILRGIYANNADGLKITGCRISRNNVGVYAQDYCFIESNYFDSNTFSDIHFEFITFGIIQGNYFAEYLPVTPTPDSHYILVENSRGIQIQGQQVFMERGTAIKLVDSRAITMSALSSSFIEASSWQAGHLGLFVEADCANIILMASDNVPMNIVNSDDVTIL
ncbi:right-handed parallel beta-helix repeat-containing protein [Chengkuizengella axinellae]|uniref:Glycosyl hydrolase family 28-related protein n=1 Tax=Chengkuizengella axinellae TaxID=3064388 RepID=A0ABT9IW47_9BACL|nr:right-handed parallel beta-helix repeat-containing protein [Chengkuizengella sp. 2205SS18-9]MDP5273560.1 glycosyl hydrolase family 28-related protein [Chengkuizengella sp. 2205SS18-9]